MRKVLIGAGLAGCVALLLTLSHSPAPGDTTVVTMASAQTVTGLGITSVGTLGTPPSAGGDHFTFQFTGVGTAGARIELSNDGTNWSPVYTFKELSDFYQAPVCGACLYRVRVLSASATNTVTVTATLAGAALFVATTYTPTQTPTNTPTGTRTPTATPTRTASNTPTVTTTPTLRPTATSVPTPIGGYPTPTVTPTRTRTPTKTPT